MPKKKKSPKRKVASPRHIESRTEVNDEEDPAYGGPVRRGAPRRIKPVHTRRVGADSPKFRPVAKLNPVRGRHSRGGRVGDGVTVPRRTESDASRPPYQYVLGTTDSPTPSCNSSFEYPVRWPGDNDPPPLSALAEDTPARPCM